MMARAVWPLTFGHHRCQLVPARLGQVFSLPRSEAASIVLNQPNNADYGAVLQQVQSLVTEKKARLVASPPLVIVAALVLEELHVTEFVRF